MKTAYAGEEELHPVMVWIHGGGFQFGSANSEIYGPERLLQEDVVLVSLNYRLGALGFLSTVSEEIPGNLGHWDQALGLRWVSENIHHFGGDPGQVTLFGESAGSLRSIVFMKICVPSNILQIQPIRCILNVKLNKPVK